MQPTLSELASLKESSAATLQDLTETQTNLQHALAKLDANEKGGVEELEKTSVELVEARQKLMHLQQELESVKGSAGDSEKAQQKLAEAKDQLLSAQKEAQDLRAEVDKVKQDVEREKQDLQTQLKHTKEEMQSLEDLAQTTGQLSEQLANAQSDLENANKEIERLQSESKTELDNLRAELKAAQSAASGLDDAVKSAVSEVQAEYVSARQKQLSAFEDQKVELDGLRQALDEAQSAASGHDEVVKSAVAEVQKDYKEKMVGMQSMQAKIASLEEERFKLEKVNEEKLALARCGSFSIYPACGSDLVVAEHEAAFKSAQAEHEKTLASLEEEATSRARDAASTSHISELQQLRKQTEETISQVRSLLLVSVCALTGTVSNSFEQPMLQNWSHFRHRIKPLYPLLPTRSLINYQRSKST